MHGHWVIDVRNPDGTLADHRDFENTASGYGQELLAVLLSATPSLPTTPSSFPPPEPPRALHPRAISAAASSVRSPRCRAQRSASTTPVSRARHTQPTLLTQAPQVAPSRFRATLRPVRRAPSPASARCTAPAPPISPR
jgi:hypothetical protein